MPAMLSPSSGGAAYGMGGSPPKSKPPTATPSGAKVKQAAKKKAAPPRPTTAAAPRPAAQRAAVEQYTGVMAAPLNELSSAEQRARDVAARRQSDAQQYAAYVMGQQGSIQAAAVKQDQAAAKAHAGIQTGTNAANMQLQAGLQAQRAAQGLTGAVPAQQLAGTVDAAQRTNTILGGMGQHLNTQADANQGRAAFLKVAAQQQLMANQRAIAGDEFNQVSDIRREKVGLLSQKEQLIAQQQQAEAAAAADIAEAEMRANDAAADRASRETIAAGATDTRRDIASAQLSNAQLQGRANRRVRLKAAEMGARANGYVSPADQRRRNTSVSKAEDMRAEAVRHAREAVKVGSRTPQEVNGYLDAMLKNLPPEVRNYALAAALGRKARVTKKGQPSAAKRYYAWLNRIKSGAINF